MVFSKSNTIVKRKKKPKKSKVDGLKVIIKPKSYDGSSNWCQLQQVCKMLDKDKKCETSTKQIKDGNSSSAYKTDDKSSRRKDFRTDVAKSKSANSSPGKMLNDAKSKPKSSPYKKKPQSLAKNSPAFAKHADDQKNEGSDQFSFNFSQKDGDVKENSKFRNNIRLTNAVAMDCEMVGTGPAGVDSVVARVSIVNSFGECIYDVFVKPKEEVTDYRTRISGVRASDLEKGKELFEVQKEVLSIINDRIVVGHALKHDFDVLFISHPKWKIRDTACYKPYRDLNGGRTPSLKKLTSQILGCEIQGGEHSSVEDAQAAMLLYLRHKKEWERQLRAKKRKKAATDAEKTS
ncbi:uncharacterized protein LOC129216306 [Uloborus diversus]|uniref:uncharacterized protein LOC129216306 n=1 Tax=Uloborus diversus TaxID=327109 RepID=UPI002409A402|nr:uncharacterized protein LOC129216306 [Uloborus diversus]